VVQFPCEIFHRICAILMAFRCSEGMLFSARQANSNRNFGRDMHMVSAKIIQFGEDSCHRSMVLQEAGYAVKGCRSVKEFRAALHSRESADAVVITDESGNLPNEAISAAKTDSPLPVILFANSMGTYAESSFDLVVPILTPPAKWLAKIQEKIQESRKRRTGSH
jgi:hypothetical protein